MIKSMWKVAAFYSFTGKPVNVQLCSALSFDTANSAHQPDLDSCWEFWIFGCKYSFPCSINQGQTMSEHFLRCFSSYNLCDTNVDEFFIHWESWFMMHSSLDTCDHKKSTFYLKWKHLLCFRSESASVSVNARQTHNWRNNHWNEFDSKAPKFDLWRRNKPDKHRFSYAAI